MSKSIITDFTYGEISRKSDGRSDLGAYYKSCSELRNMYVTPQGVASRMPGTEFVTAYLGAVTDYVAVRIIPFWIDEDKSYIFVFTPAHAYWIKEGTKPDNLSTQEIKDGSSNAFTVTGTDAQKIDQIENFQYAQYNDSLFLCHPIMGLRKITYSGGSFVWATSSGPTGFGNPSAITTMQQRLFLGGFSSKPDYYAGSKSGYPETWTFNENPVTSTTAFNFQLSAGRDYSGIRWLASNEDGLVAGTATSEVVIPGGEGGITALNGGGQRLTSCYGSCKLQALKMGLSLLFVGRTGERLREYAFTGVEGSANSPDLTVLADDILEGGVKQMCFQNSPFECLFVLRNDGVLCMFTYDRNTGVSAWSRVEVGGFVESIATAPGEGQDYTYIVVQRLIGSTTQRYIERFTEYSKPDKKDWKYANSCKTIDFGHKAMTKYSCTISGIFSTSTVFTVTGTVPNVLKVGSELKYGNTKRTISSISGQDITIDEAFPDYSAITKLMVGGGIITVTVSSHGLSDGDHIKIDGIKAHKDYGDGVYYDAPCELNGRVFRIADKDTDTFTLQTENFQYIDGSDYAEYVSGGTVYILNKIITGMGHLEGCECSVVADGGTQANKSVDSGGMTIERLANIVQIGLPYTSYIKTNRLVPQAMGETRRINRVHVRFYRSLGCTISKTLDGKGQDISFRENELNLESPGVYTGDKSEVLSDDYNTDGYIYLIQREPLPFNICAVGIDYRVDSKAGGR